MNRVFNIFLVVSAVLSAGCRHEHPHAEDAEAGHKHEAGVIVLHDEVAGRFGVATDTLRPGAFHSTVRAAGRVMQAGADDAVVSAPTAGIVHFGRGINAGAEVGKNATVATIDARGTTGGDANRAALAAVESATIELERVEGLYRERLATQSELYAAQSALAQAQAAYSPTAASGQAKAPVSGTITSLLAKEGQYVGVGDPIASIGKGSGSVLRIELPRRHYREATSFTDATVDIPGSEPYRVSALGGRRTGSSTGTDAGATGAYIPLYFSVPGNGAPVGTPFTAYLIGTEREGVLSVPVEAVSEQQGAYYVYERHGAEHYIKRRIEPGDSDGQRIEVKSGLEPGMEIVVAGMPAVRLAETSAVAPQGHSHNH